MNRWTKRWTTKFTRMLLLSAIAGLIFLSGCRQNADNSSVEPPASESQVSSAAESTQSSEVESSMPEEYTFEPGSIDYPILQEAAPAADAPIATIKTSMGDMRIVLYPEQAPKTVENFVSHAKQKYYDGLTFHRVIEEFMIQGGDPNGDGTGGESIYGEPFEDEFNKDLVHFHGALSMANSGPNSNGSQFFIVQATQIPYPKEAFAQAGYPESFTDKYLADGGTPHLDGMHTVFGMVIEGMDVLDAVAKVEVEAPDDPQNPRSGRPIEPVTIESITIENA